METPSYTSGREQAQRLRQLALQELNDQAGIYQAYLWLGTQEAGKIILDHLSTTVLLQSSGIVYKKVRDGIEAIYLPPHVAAWNEGKKLLVQQILRMIATAPEELERLREERARVA